MDWVAKGELVMNNKPPEIITVDLTTQLTRNYTRAREERDKYQSDLTSLDRCLIAIGDPTTNKEILSNAQRRLDRITNKYENVPEDIRFNLKMWGEKLEKARLILNSHKRNIPKANSKTDL
jgi:hypothetical protein